MPLNSKIIPVSILLFQNYSHEISDLLFSQLCWHIRHRPNDFHYKGKPSHAIAKSIYFAVSKDEWNTKEDTGKSMKNALYVLRYAKRHLSGQSNVEQ